MKFGIRKKILFITVTTFLVAIGVNTFITGRMFKREYSAALQSKMDVIASTLRSQIERLTGLGITIQNVEGFETQCQEVLRKHQEVAYVMVVQTNGKILFHNDTTRHGMMINDPEILNILEQSRHRECISKIAKKTYYNTIVPVGDGSNRPAVAVIVGFPTALIDNKIHELRRYSFIVAFVSLTLATFFLLTSLSISVTKPMSKLVATIQQIRKSSDLSKRVEITFGDELGDLAHSFNQMTEDLQKTTTSIDNLNREIAERQKVEKTLRVNKDELHNQNKFLHNVLESLTHPFYVVDANDYTIVMANSAAHLGMLEKNMTCHALTHNKDHHCSGNNICPLEELKKTRKPVTVEHFHLDKNGKPRHTEINGYPIFDSEGNIIQMIESCYDITARKRAEQRQTQLLVQLESANQELRDFAYIVSHDLKAPLRGVKTLAGWMLNDYADKLDEEGKKQLELLSSRIDRMHNLIDGILQYSRIGREKEEWVEMDLNKLVPEIIDTLAPPQNIIITIENQLPVVKFEQTRITQIFQNLLSNAVKYIDKPEGRIKISCVEDNGCWKFSIADNGPGIEEKYFDRIFQIFQTLSSRDNFESTGVGLTVIKKIVELYDGKIWIESKVGQGSTFFFTLPMQSERVQNEQFQTNHVN